MDTEIFPVVAPEGTLTVNDVDVAFITFAAVPLNFTTLLAGAVSKLFPEITTEAPWIPEVGEILLMEVTRTVKSEGDVAVLPFAITVIFPVVAPTGTMAMIPSFVASDTVASTPLNLTKLAEGVVLKFEPVMIIDVPTTPEAGETPAIIGSGTVSFFLQELKQMNKSKIKDQTYWFFFIK